MPLFLMYFVVIFSIILFDIYRKPKICYDFIRLFNIFFIILYPLQGAFFAFNHIFWMEGKKYKFDYGNEPIMVFGMILLSYIFVISGYFISNKIFKNRLYLNIKKNNISVFKWSLLFIFIFVLLVILYTSRYGGLLNSFELAARLRSGYVERDPFSFLKRFFWFSNLAFLVSGSALMFIKCNKKIYILFFLAIICNLVGAVLTAGRGAAVGPFLLLGIIYCYKVNKLIPFRLLVTIFSLILFVFIGDQLFDYIRKSIQGVNYDFGLVSVQEFILNAFCSFLANFQYAYVSLEAHFSHYSMLRDGVRLGVDFPLAILSLLPSKVLGISIPHTISFHNSFFVRGEYISTTPPGLIAFSLYSFSFPGIFLFPFLYGMIGNIITILARSAWNTWWVKAGYGIVAFTWSIFHGNADPRVVLNQSLYIIFFITLLFLFGYINIGFHSKFKSFK